MACLRTRPTSKSSLRTRLSTTSIFFALLLAAAAEATSEGSSGEGRSRRAQCVLSRSLELAGLAACGDKGSLAYCFSHPHRWGSSDTAAKVLSDDIAVVYAANLDKCFVDAGCTAEEAAIEAEWTVRRCDEQGSSPDMTDLRRRQGGGNNNNNSNNNNGGDDDDVTTKPNNNRPQTSRPTANRQTTPTAAPVAANTNSDVTTAPTTAPSTATPTASTSPRTTTPPLQTTSTSTPLVCHTPTTVSTTTCPLQSTGALAGIQTLPCFPTTTSYLVCAEGLRCMTDLEGLPTCLRVENRLTTAGIIVTIAFTSFLVVAFAATCFFCCRDRRQQRRLERAADAASIAREAKLAALLTKKRPSVNVRSVSAASDQPLMPPSAPQGYSGGASYLTGPQQYGQPDPFVDPRMQ